MNQKLFCVKGTQERNKITTDDNTIYIVFGSSVSYKGFFLLEWLDPATNLVRCLKRV